MSDMRAGSGDQPFPTAVDTPASHSLQVRNFLWGGPGAPVQGSFSAVKPLLDASLHNSQTFDGTLVNDTIDMLVEDFLVGTGQES